MTAIEIIDYSSWWDFKRSAIQEFFHDGVFRPGRYLFRGVGSDTWPLVSSFDRQFASVEPAHRVRLWGHLLTEFRRACESAGIDADIVEDEGRLLSLGQHYGLPTRLIDWSESPYVAAFFAFRRALTSLLSDRERAAVWVLDSESSIWSSSFGVDLYRPRDARGNDRIKGQVGAFTHFKSSLDSLEDYVLSMRPEETVLWKITLPVTEAVAALADLDAMSMNARNLFPDVQGLAEAAVLRVLVQAQT